MKKSFKILIALLFCLCPVLLTACGNTESYMFSVISSSTALGRVSGASSSPVNEGKTVYLTAKSNDEEKNPLICWVKNNEYLVEVATVKDGVLDTTLELTSSESTQGKYTAVFYEEADAMMYGYVNPVIETEGLPTENVESKITLSYALMSAGSNNYLPYSYEMGAGKMPNILYFGGLGINNQFKFKIDLELTIEGEKEVHTITSDTIISKTNIENISYKCKRNSDSEITLTLSFSKIDKNLTAIYNQ